MRLQKTNKKTPNTVKIPRDTSNKHDSNPFSPQRTFCHRTCSFCLNCCQTKDSLSQNNTALFHQEASIRSAKWKILEYVMQEDDICFKFHSGLLVNMNKQQGKLVCHYHPPRLCKRSWTRLLDLFSSFHIRNTEVTSFFFFFLIFIHNPNSHSATNPNTWAIQIWKYVVDKCHASQICYKFDVYDYFFSLQKRAA